MLLRVTQASGGNSESHPHSSTQTLHACLATGASPDNESPGNTAAETQATNGTAVTPEQEGCGEIFTVGRKNCTVVIDDKCVSRRHASVRLLSNTHVDVGSLSQATLAALEFGKPESDEEKAAVASSRTGVICVVKDCGSKFGTYVSVDEGLNAQALGKEKHRTNGDDDTGDETDDDAALNNVKYVDLTEKQSKAVRMLGETATELPKFQKMDTNSSTILLPLSHSMNETKSMKDSHVTILFGPQGSGIRLTLIPLKFTFSRLASKDQDRLLSRLHTIGATHSPQWDVANSTHLVTKENKATAKHIMAWACCKPTVTQDYVLALLTRQKCTDAMPQEEDYIPPGSSQLGKPLDSPSKALKGYRIAVLLEDDSAPLSESAGAEVLHVYKDGPKDAKEFGTWWKEQIQKAAEEKLALTVMETSSKKAATWSKMLSGLDCRFTNQKNLAKAITAKEEEGMMLMDINKEPIEKLKGWDDVKEDEVVEFGNHNDELDHEQPIVQDDDATDNEDEQKMPVSTQRTKRGQEEVEKTEIQDDVPKSKRRKGIEPKENGKKTEPSPKKTSTSSKRAREEEEEPSNENSAPPAKKTVTTKTIKSKPDTDTPAEKVIIDEESVDESIPEEDKRESLQVTNDGWYVAAPIVRKNYRKKIEEVEGAVEENPKHAAKTARVKGLVVREYVRPAPRTVSRSNNGIKKDFKRFRKNHVIRGFTTFNSNSQANHRTVRLVAVLPKESERQRELEMKQQELDREQAYADALFNDNGATGKKGRRSGGGIAGMLSQPKRGRTKR